MGFRVGAYAKVWEIEGSSDTMTKCRLSISVKNKQTGDYVQEFSGYVAFVGTACARQALTLKEGDRIKLGDCDLVTKYDKEKKKTYYNFKIFSFEKMDDQTTHTVDDGGGVDEPVEDSNLPF